MFCWKCGKELSRGSDFCCYCGADLRTKRNTASSVRVGTYSSEESIMRSIIDRNTEYYLAQFRHVRFEGKSKLNWASFFFSFAHAAYRGVWREWLCIFRFPLIVDIILNLVSNFLKPSSPLATIVSLVSMGVAIWLFVTYILFAKRFNGIYMAHVEQKIRENNQTPDPSMKRVICAVLMVGGLIFIFSFILAFLMEV